MRIPVLLFILFTTPFLKAQNLVPNGSFEERTGCPETLSVVELCSGWKKYCLDEYTPDYYNQCSSPNAVGVPLSIFFSQPDRRGCGAYFGLVTWSRTVLDEREHIGIELIEPMQIGQKYFLSFYTVRGGFFDHSDSPSNNIGLRLSTIPFSPVNPTPIDNYAHLYSASIIYDDENWVKVSGSVIADSAYNYLVMGNFFDDAHTDTIQMNCQNCINYLSYYLIDDVCVSTDSLLCNGGLDELPCSVNLTEVPDSNFPKVIKNPIDQFLELSFNQGIGPVELSMYDSIGRLLFIRSYGNTNKITLDVGEYDAGLLFLQLKIGEQSHLYKLFKN